MFSLFVEALATDKVIGPKLQKSGLIIKFIYTEPDGQVMFNFKDKPAKEGYFGDYSFDPNCPWKEDVWTKQTLDFSHKFWQGKENAVTALPLRKITAGGNIIKLMSLIPFIRSTFKVYQNTLKANGYENLIIK